MGFPKIVDFNKLSHLFFISVERDGRGRRRRLNGLTSQPISMYVVQIKVWSSTKEKE